MSTHPEVEITGIGQCGPVAEDPRSIPEMVLEAVEAALEDAGLGHDAIDAVATASVDLYDGLTASNIAVTEVVGAVMKPETRIAGDGLCAAIAAWCPLRAGAYETVLVVAHGKASMAQPWELQPWAMDPILLQALGVDFRVVAGLEARLMLESDPGALERWAGLAAVRRRAAGMPTSAMEVLASPSIASPLLRDMEAPPADAAYALVMRARPPQAARIRLAGVGYDLETHDPGARPLGRRPGLERALEMARRVAGAGPFGLVEPSCRYPHEEELLLAALGTNAEVAPSGGLYSGDAPCAAGLGRLVEATRQLRAQPSLGRALAHGAWGPAGQGQAVAILEVAA